MSPLISRNPGFDTRVQKLVDLFNSAEMTSGYGVPSDVITNRAMEIIHRMHSTYVAKDSDYAADGKPMGNLRTSEKLGIPAWRAVLLRMNDKRSRIESFIKKGSFAVDDEKITDTIIDLAVYALLGDTLRAEMFEDETASDMFLRVSFCSIKCKILHDMNAMYKQAPNWVDGAWPEVTDAFDWLIKYSYDNSELAQR